MLKKIFYGLIKVAVVWSLASYFSVLVCFFAAKDCILRFNKKPWSSKKRDDPPKCLRDPKYGVHKYVRVDVSSVDFCYDFLMSLCSEIVFVLCVCDIVCYHFRFVDFVFLDFHAFTENSFALRWEWRSKQTVNVVHSRFPRVLVFMASSNHRIFTRLLVRLAIVPLSTKFVSMEYFFFAGRSHWIYLATAIPTDQRLTAIIRLTKSAKTSQPLSNTWVRSVFISFQ